MKKGFKNTAKKYHKPQLIKVSLKELDKKARLLGVHCLGPGRSNWGLASAATSCCT